MDDMRFHDIELERGRPMRGTARVVELGFDLEKMKRFVTYYLDPPHMGEHYMTTYLSQSELSDGEYIRRPMTDEEEAEAVRSSCRVIGYELVEDGSEREGDN